MKSYKKLILLFLITFSIATNVYSENEDLKADWTILIFMETPDINHQALTNIVQMTQGCTSKNKVNILVEWHAGGLTAERFLIKKNAIIPIEKTSLAHHMEKNIIDAATWAYENYPSEHHGLILRGKGSGILPPEDNEYGLGHFDTIKPDPALPMGQEFDGIVTKNFLFSIIYASEVSPPHMHQGREGLTNKELANVIKEISEHVLHDKLDFLGMDASAMQMFGVGYELRYYLHYLIGSQDWESPEGYDYKKLVHVFSCKACKESNVKTCVKNIVRSFYDSRMDDEDEIESYSLSAVDLTLYEKVKDNLDEIVKLCKHCIQDSSINIKQLLFETRLACLQSHCNPVYIDLYSFYHHLGEHFKQLNNPPEDIKLYVAEIKVLIHEGKKNIRKTIVENAVSWYEQEAKGIAIYFPLDGVHKAYFETEFAQKSWWPTLVEWVCELSK